MAKKAFLVTFSPRTRVVVDVEDETLENSDDFDAVIGAAREKMIKEGIWNYLDGDNCEEAVLDEDMPYDPEWDDK